MAKQKLRWFWKIPTRVFLGLFIIFGVASIYSLRNNNLMMIDLRNAVYGADQSGNDVNGALNKLRSYVYAHMNTNLSSGGNTIKPPIQLKYTYERLAQAEQTRLKAANAQVYTDAQNFCQAQNPTDFSGRNRVPCVAEYVTSHGVQAHPVPAALYQFDFVSPTWSPDLAGWSLLVTITFLLLTILSYAAHRLHRRRKLWSLK